MLEHWLNFFSRQMSHKSKKWESTPKLELLLLDLENPKTHIDCPCPSEVPGQTIFLMLLKGTRTQLHFTLNSRSTGSPGSHSSLLSCIFFLQNWWQTGRKEGKGYREMTFQRASLDHPSFLSEAFSNGTEMKSQVCPLRKRAWWAF